METSVFVRSIVEISPLHVSESVTSSGLSTALTTSCTTSIAKAYFSLRSYLCYPAGAVTSSPASRISLSARLIALTVKAFSSFSRHSVASQSIQSR